MSNYSMEWIMERLGPVATIEDAEAAYQAAEDWYNKMGIDSLIWYSEYRDNNPHAESIDDPDDRSMAVENWAEIVIFNRAVAAH